VGGLNLSPFISNIVMLFISKNYSYFVSLNSAGHTTGYNKTYKAYPAGYAS